MLFIVKTLLASFWMVILPGCIGVLFLRSKETVTWSESFLCGWLFYMAFAEVLILPMLFLNRTLKELSIVYGAVLLLVGVIGLVEIIRNRWIFRESGKILQKASVWYWIAVALILVQVAYSTVYAHFDADDSFYVGSAVSGVSTNTIYSIDPYTGVEYAKLPSRYVLSPYPVLLAVISKLSLGVHPATVAHCYYPAVFMILTYLVVTMISRELFPEDTESQGRFLLFAVVLVWFSAYSVYNRENFQLIRIWQGKAALTAVLLPTLLYLGLKQLAAKEHQYSWAVLLLASMSCCLTTTMGVLLAPVLIMLCALVGAVLRRNPRILLYSLLCCIPNLALGVLYAVIR